MIMVTCWERCESRGSRTVLREADGEVPLVYSPYILAIQDQMRLNFTSHSAKTDLGEIGKAGKTIQYGIIQHSVLAVSERNEPFGLLSVEYFDYSHLDQSINRDKRKVEAKANIFWIKSLDEMRKNLRESDKKLITVADREGDFYEFIFNLIQHKEEFVIRSKHNRILGEYYKKNGQKLREKLEQSAVKGLVKINIQDVKSREIKEIQLNVKALAISLPVPKQLIKSTEEKSYKSITLNVVSAYNDEYEWVLLTSLPVETLEQLTEVLKIYKARWHIEDYHKVLKTGYQVDEIYLHSSRKAITNLLTVSAVSACRLYWLIYMGRTEKHLKVDQ